jgi:anti-sigma factor RsiW
MSEEKMNCEEICELLTAYLDGEVAPGERAYIEAHLPGCPRCRAELENLSATQDNLRAMLKSTAEEVSPSPQAWEKVRARLDTKSSWFNRLHRLFTGSKIWQVATVTAAVVVIALVAAVWQFGGVGQAPPPTPVPAPPAPAPTPTPSPAPGPERIVEFERVEPATFAFGERVEVMLSFTNESSETRIMSPFPPEINIERPNMQPPESVVRSFAAGNGEIRLEPGELVTHQLAWDQKDDSGQQVVPGWYGVEITAASRGISETRGGHARGWATKVLVQPPQGVTEGTIELRETRTASGITFTLQRLELTATGLNVYAFNTPPDYGLPQGPMLPPPQLMSLHATAEYSVDGSMVKQTGPSGIRFLDDGMLHTWDNLDPVPSDARQLTFTIIKLGDWEGPWVFTVSLE